MITLQDIPRVKPGCSAKKELRTLDEVGQERLYLATRAKDLLGYAGLVADVTGELPAPKIGPLAEALAVLSFEVLDVGSVIEYQMQKMVEATKEKILGGELANWAHGYFAEAGWSKTELSNYSLPIPEFVIDKAIRIKEAVPSVTFHVQHLRDPKADPFLVAHLNREIYYIDAWDEPKFEGRVRHDEEIPF